MSSSAIRDRNWTLSGVSLSRCGNTARDMFVDLGEWWHNDEDRESLRPKRHRLSDRQLVQADRRKEFVEPFSRRVRIGPLDAIRRTQHVNEVHTAIRGQLLCWSCCRRPLRLPRDAVTRSSGALPYTNGSCSFEGRDCGRELA